MNILSKFKLDNLSRPTQLMLFALLLVVFVLLILLSKSWSNSQVLKNIVIEGNDFVNKNEIYNSISKYVLKKEKKDVNLDTIKNILLSNPYILNVNLSITITGNLKVDINERIPIAYLINNNGEIKFADKDAFILPYKLLQKNIDLPVISNLEFNTKADSNALRNGCVILEFIKNNAKDDFYNQISELLFDKRYKSFNIIIEQYPGEIKFGRADELNEKLTKLERLFLTEKGYDVLRMSDYIDLRWNNQIVAGKI